MQVTEIIPQAGIEKLQDLIRKGKLSAEEIKQFYRLVEAAENFDISHPLEAYRPIPATRDGGPHQLTFHKDGHKGRCFFGGNQSGKTRAGSREFCMHMTGIYPVWFPKERMRKGPQVGRILCVDFQKSVSEIIEPALRECLPDRFVREWKKNSQGFLSRVFLRNGSRFDIVTHEMETKSLEGWQGDVLWMDEPPPRDKFIACARGLMRRAGIWMMTGTLISEPWIYDEALKNPDVYYIVVNTRDNPYLTEDEIMTFERTLTEEEKTARLEGKPMHLTGLRYKEFDPGIHVKPASTLIQPHWPRWMICDPHDQRPFAMMWFAIDEMNRMWIYNEWPMGKMFHEMKSSHLSIKDYRHIIDEVEAQDRVYRRIMDGRAAACPKIGEEETKSLMEMCNDAGILPPFEPSFIRMTTGSQDPAHLRIKERLRISPVTQEPSIFVLEHCVNVIYAFQHNMWAESRTYGVVKEVQAQFAKDFLDLIAYGEMDDPHFMPESDWARVAEQGKQPKWAEPTQEWNGPGIQGYGSMQDF